MIRITLSALWFCTFSTSVVAQPQTGILCYYAIVGSVSDFSEMCIEGREEDIRKLAVVKEKLRSKIEVLEKWDEEKFEAFSAEQGFSKDDSSTCERIDLRDFAESVLSDVDGVSANVEESLDDFETVEWGLCL